MPVEYTSEFKRTFDLALERAALLVIDVQYASSSRRHGLGAKLASEGRAELAAWRFDRLEHQVVPNLVQLLELCRRHAAAVVYVTFGSATGDFQDVAPYLRELARGLDNCVGSSNHDVLVEIAPRPGDIQLNKTTASAFRSTGLDLLLRERGVTQLLLTGVSTNSCVDGTGRDGSDLGYDSILVEDCSSAGRPELHAAAVQNFNRITGEVMGTSDILRHVAHQQVEN